MIKLQFSNNFHLTFNFISDHFDQNILMRNQCESTPVGVDHGQLAYYSASAVYLFKSCSRFCSALRFIQMRCEKQKKKIIALSWSLTSRSWWTKREMEMRSREALNILSNRFRLIYQADAEPAIVMRRAEKA